MSQPHRNWIGAVSATALALALGCSESPGAPAAPHDASALVATASAKSASGPQIQFAKLKLFFEFNSTDNDLGLQLLLDAPGWSLVEGRDPSGTEIVEFEGTGSLGQLGLTELFFESAEPSPDEVLAIFPPGTYSFSGITVDGKQLAGAAVLSHNLPPAPSFSPSNGERVDMNTVGITWSPIAGLASFQVIVVDETLGRELVADVGPSVTSLTVPTTFLRRNTLYKVEVLAVGHNGNKTISEGTFRTKP